MRKLKLHELGRASVEEVKQQPKLPIVVILDNIRSGLNVGSIFRTCDALGVKNLILTGITPKPPHREIHKTAIGATESVDWQYEHDPVIAVQSLRQEGFSIVPVEQTDASVSLEQFAVSTEEKYALIFGNEVEGVSDPVIESCNQSIEIPQHGTKHSFNVAVSAGIVLWEFAKALR